MRYQPLWSLSRVLRLNDPLGLRVIASACALSMAGGALLPLASLASPHAPSGESVALAVDAAPRDVTEAASRGQERPAEVEPPAEPAAVVDVWLAPPPPPASVAGLNETQTRNAFAIVWEGGRMNLPTHAKIVAIATALQESRLRNLASGVIPESQHLPNEGMGYDFDSVGLFQQRPSMGWGSVAECMDPSYSAHAFYSALNRVRGWQGLPVTVAAQRVQGSAFPSAYAKHEAAARQIVEELRG